MLDLNVVEQQYRELVTWHGGEETLLAAQMRHHIDHARQQQDPHYVPLPIPVAAPQLMQ